MKDIHIKRGDEKVMREMNVDKRKREREMNVDKRERENDI